MTDPTLVKLRELLLNEFSEDELKALCASIDIDYEKLAGTGTFGKTRALLDTIRSQDKLRNLQAKVREAKPVAYEAAGFSTLIEIEDPLAMTTPPAPRSASSTRTSYWPWLALALLVLLCTIVGVVSLLPRLQTANQPVVNATLPLSAATALSANSTATETPPAIVEVTDALDKGAGDLTGAESTPEAKPITADVTPTPAAESAETSVAVVITVTATSTPMGNTASISPTSAPTSTHPSIYAIRGLNDQLPKFYTGEVAVQDLQQFWTGEALRSVIAFGTLRLPRALRLQPSQRNTIQATYAYRREPALVRESGASAVVTSREFWRYATNANPIEICETRDYVYNLVRVDGQFKVSTFNSRLIESGCSQQ